MKLGNLVKLRDNSGRRTDCGRSSLAEYNNFEVSSFLEECEKSPGSTTTATKSQSCPDDSQVATFWGSASLIVVSFQSLAKNGPQTVESHQKV